MNKYLLYIAGGAVVVTASVLVNTIMGAGETLRYMLIPIGAWLAFWVFAYSLVWESRPTLMQAVTLGLAGGLWGVAVRPAAYIRAAPAGETWLRVIDMFVSLMFAVFVTYFIALAVNTWIQNHRASQKGSR